MHVFTEYLPYDALAKRTISLDHDKLSIHFKSMNRNYSDEFPYAKINHDIKVVRRGEKEWSGVVYGLIVGYIVFLILTKMSQALYLRTPFLVIQFVLLGIAAWLGMLMFLKKEFFYLFDSDGECIAMIKATPKSRVFVKNLREKLGGQGTTA